MPASILSAGTNRHDSVLRIAGSSVWRPVRQIVLDHPVRNTLVAVAEQLAKRNSVHEQLERQPIVRAGTIRKVIHLTANDAAHLPPPGRQVKRKKSTQIHTKRRTQSAGGG